MNVKMEMSKSLEEVLLSSDTKWNVVEGHVEWKKFFSSAMIKTTDTQETLYLILHSKSNGDTKEMTQEVVYNGLKNQGATCYLNSALQVLFMTKEFRETVKRLQNTANFDELLYQLEQLFENLEGDHKCVSTDKIIKSLSIKNVFEQQDAVEWFEKILSAVSPDASQVFEGTLRKTLRCLKKDNGEFQEESKFFSVPLSICARHDDIFTVIEGLEAFFKTTRFDEDNWMYCDDCDEKTDSEISFNIQKYPTILNLHLKRFYFDYMKMGYQKNCCPVEIPPTLTYFRSCIYDLYGIINHSGVYGGGHYYAYIKSPKNNEWYCFNDSHVSKITDKDFLKSSRTAYMIVYRKRECLPESSTETATADELQGSMPEEIKNITAAENQVCQNSTHPILQTKMRVSNAKICKKKRKEEGSVKVTKMGKVMNSSFCEAKLTKKFPSNLQQCSMNVPPKLQTLLNMLNHSRLPSITPGTMLVLHTGHHQGKWVVFLKYLPSGLLLFTGPFALNTVPMSIASPNSVNAAATKVDISGVRIPETLTDTSFKRRRQRKLESKGENGLEMGMEKLLIAEQYKREQRGVDSQVLICIRKVRRLRRLLSSGPYQHGVLNLGQNVGAVSVVTSVQHSVRNITYEGSESLKCDF